LRQIELNLEALLAYASDVVKALCGNAFKPEHYERPSIDFLLEDCHADNALL
jgi:hypothetical protein